MVALAMEKIRHASIYKHGVRMERLERQEVLMAKSEQEIRRLADKFRWEATKELREDPEFQQLAVDDV